MRPETGGRLRLSSRIRRLRHDPLMEEKSPASADVQTSPAAAEP
jgi:hypothetical protein